MKSKQFEAQTHFHIQPHESNHIAEGQFATEHPSTMHFVLDTVRNAWVVGAEEEVRTVLQQARLIYFSCSIPDLGSRGAGAIPRPRLQIPSANDGSAESVLSAKSPLRNRGQAAAAIMAALSVESGRFWALPVYH